MFVVDWSSLTYFLSLFFPPSPLWSFVIRLPSLLSYLCLSSLIPRPLYFVTRLSTLLSYPLSLASHPLSIFLFFGSHPSSLFLYLFSLLPHLFSFITCLTNPFVIVSLLLSFFSFSSLPSLFYVPCLATSSCPFLFVSPPSSPVNCMFKSAGIGCMRCSLFSPPPPPILVAVSNF